LPRSARPGSALQHPCQLGELAARVLQDIEREVGIVLARSKLPVGRQGFDWWKLRLPRRAVMAVDFGEQDDVAEIELGAGITIPLLSFERHHHERGRQLPFTYYH